MVMDTEKAQKWISQGAQPSDAVKRIIEKVSMDSGDSEDGEEV
jgi:ribosomal protein S16